MDIPRIKVTPRGPFIVTGSVPISEQVITPSDKGSYRMVAGRTFDQDETYALCRCGKSTDAPFCDGAHVKADFQGTETASREQYAERAKTYTGPTLVLTDDGRCGLARFCHRENSEVWTLTTKSDQAELRAAAILAAQECPSGRLVIRDKDTGEVLEPQYEPAIEVLQDPERGVSGGLAVKGGIQIEGADGYEYEVQNRALLCRCGHSRRMPYCDASHVVVKFRDSHK